MNFEIDCGHCQTSKVARIHRTARNPMIIRITTMKPQHTMRTVILLVLILFVMARTASAQLVVHLHQPPANELKASELWVVDLTNPSKTTLTVYLHGTAVEVSDPANPILVVDAQSASFSLPPGFKMVTGADISPIKINTSDPVYRNAVTTTGEVPTGDYEVCVEVINKNTGASLGKDCYNQHIDRTSPPILVTPFDGSTVSDLLPLFTWVPPAPLNGLRAGYRFRLVQLYGQQTPYDAMLSNPAFFTASNISSTIFRYTLASRPFVAGMQYAWQVSATTTNTFRPISLGSSEVFAFTYDPNSLDGGVLNGGIHGDGSVGSLNAGNLGGGNTIGTLDLGPYSDSTLLYNFWSEYLIDNFFIPAGYDFLDPGTGGGDLVLVTKYNDPNATNYVSNNPNDSAGGTGCGRAPSVSLTVHNPPFDQNAVNWHEPFAIDWSVKHSQPIDHVDLQVALFGHEDAPLAHYIYRTSNGSYPTATTFDPRPYILNPDAAGMICLVTVVAVDVLGRSSGPVQKMYVNGNFPAIPHIAPPSMAPTPDFGFSSTDSLIVKPGGGSERVSICKAGSYKGNGSQYSTLTVVLANHDSQPHHFRSVYTPPYENSPSLTPGGVGAIDFGEVLPGATASVTLPSSAPQCYVWTLFDEEGASSSDVWGTSQSPTYLVTMCQP